jgi:hypothetical protein
MRLGFERRLAMIPTPASLAKAARRLDRRAQIKRKREERAKRVLERLKAGALLRRHHQRGRIVWCLVWKSGSEFVTHEAVTDALTSGQIVGVGDTLFEGAPSQTYRYAET